MGRTTPTARAPHEVASVVRRDGNRIYLSGELRTHDARAIWTALQAATKQVPRSATVEFDLAAVPLVDADVMALLFALRGEVEARGAALELTNMHPRVAAIAELHQVPLPVASRQAQHGEGPVARVGTAALRYVVLAKEFLGFVGGLVLATTSRHRRRPHGGHWKEVFALIEKTGTDAMPVVFAALFVLGFILAYSTADTFLEFGQPRLSAQMIGRGMAREVAPVMTAIVLSGRSGAAFAAELGAMKVNHEIDALRTMGFEPFAWLVVPRMIALVVVTPGLVVIGNFFGWAGGALVAVTILRITLRTYIHTLESTLLAWDLEDGLIKSAAFGLGIALIGCQQGFAASAGAEDVGRHTTSTVVACLFGTVLLDAIFTVIYRSLGG